MSESDKPLGTSHKSFVVHSVIERTVVWKIRLTKSRDQILATWARAEFLMADSGWPHGFDRLLS
jgi:hypothetical protein